MSILKKINSGVVLFLIAIMLFSCNLEDFNLNKLADPSDIVPNVYAPLGYGTFKVSDLVTAAVPDAFPITPGGLPLVPVVISKSGTSFRNAAVDSVYLITHITNGTPTDMEFVLSFLSTPAGPAIGKTFSSGVVSAGAKDYLVQFALGPLDRDNLMNSTDIGLNFTLTSTTGTITYGATKTKSFIIWISFYAPVKIWELTK